MPAEKFLKLPANGDDPQSTAATQVGGPANGGKIPGLRDDGTFDPTMFGPEVASPDVEQGVASEVLLKGDLVNTYNNNGVNGVRKAVASDYAKRARGFVIAAAATNSAVTVYKSGAPNSGVTGLVIGQQWLSDTTPGVAVNTPPTTAGSIMQKVGNASSPTMLHVDLGPAYKI